MRMGLAVMENDSIAKEAEDLEGSNGLTSEFQSDDMEVKAYELESKASRFLKSRKIRDQLSEAVYNPDRAIEEQFINIEDVKKIWTPQMLRDFLAVLGYVGGDIPVTNILEHLLKTISMLVHIRWENWSRFKSIFFPDGWEQPPCASKRDKVLPHTLNTLKEDAFLGIGSTAGEFFNLQSIYLPLVILQGKRMTTPRTRPLPFIRSKSEDIAKGGFGVVTKEVIACYHFTPEWKFNLPYPEEFTVARKRFQTKGDFRMETKNLAKLASALSGQHHRLVKHIAFITVGDEKDHGSPKEFNILLPMADTDLKKLLYGEAYQPQCSDIAHLLKEALNLVDALAWLHSGPLIDGKPQVFCHMDLKLDNILVYELGEKEFPAGCWKISDFGISSLIDKPNTQLLNALQKSPAGTLALIAGEDPVGTKRRRQPGPYSAPEVHDPNGLVGTPSDVWSFGCVLVQILARGTGGIEFLVEMDEKRWTEEQTHDHFCQGTGNEAYLHPAVNRWLNSTRFHGHTANRDQQIILDCKRIIKLALQVDVAKRIDSQELRNALSTICRRHEHSLGGVARSISGSSTGTNANFPNHCPSRIPAVPSIPPDHLSPQPNPVQNTQNSHPQQHENTSLKPPSVPPQAAAVHQQPPNLSPSHTAPPTPPDDQPGSSHVRVMNNITHEHINRNLFPPMSTTALPREKARRQPPIPDRVSSYGIEAQRSVPPTQAVIQSSSAVNITPVPANNANPQHAEPFISSSPAPESRGRLIPNISEQQPSVPNHSRGRQSSSDTSMVPLMNQLDVQHRQLTDDPTTYSPSISRAEASPPKNRRKFSPFTRSIAMLSERHEKARSMSLPAPQVTTPIIQVPDGSPPQTHRHTLLPIQRPQNRTSSSGTSVLASQHPVYSISSQDALNNENAISQDQPPPRLGLNVALTFLNEHGKAQGSVSSEASSRELPPAPPIDYWQKSHKETQLARKRSGRPSVASVNVGSTNTHNFVNISKGTIMTLVSSTEAKIAFISPKGVDIATIPTSYDKSCKNYIEAPTDVTWERGSLAGNYLALRGYHKQNKKYSLHFYELKTTATQSLPYIALELKCIPITHARLPPFEKFNVSRDGRLLLGGHGKIYLAKSIEEEPYELEPHLERKFNLQRVWFSTSGLLAFAWSSGPGNKHRINWWAVKDMQRKRRIKYQEPENASTASKIKIVHFPRSPLCLLWKDDTVTLLQEATKPDGLQIQQCSLVNIQAIVVTPNEDAVVFIRLSNSTFRRPPVSKICFHRIKKIGDFFYLDEPSSEETLQYHIKEPEKCEVVIEEYEDRKSSFRVLIAHNDGQFEVKHVNIATA